MKGSVKFNLIFACQEHAVLARSLGVTQLIVAVNKMDVVAWSKTRYLEIRDLLLPFLKQVSREK